MEEYYKGSQQAGYAAEKPVNAFESLSGAVSQLREMQKMARAVADRLTGNPPADPVGAAKLQEVGGGGLIDGVERQASFIREIHADIYASLSRIENRL